jgi:hypothetical protein
MMDEEATSKKKKKSRRGEGKNHTKKEGNALVYIYISIEKCKKRKFD